MIGRLDKYTKRLDKSINKIVSKAYNQWLQGLNLSDPTQKLEYRKSELLKDLKNATPNVFINIFCTVVWGINNLLSPSWLDFTCVVIFSFISLMHLINFVSIKKELTALNKKLLADKLMR